MKILQVIDKLNVGGAERVFIDICTILFDHKQPVSALFLLNQGPLGSELNNQIERFELHRKNKWSLKKMKECSEILVQFDIIHCHFRHVYRYVSLVAKIYKIKGKIILHDHYGSIDVDRKIPFLFSSIQKPTYYIGVSQSLTDWAKNELKIQKEYIFLLENIIIKSNQKKALTKPFDFILVSNIKPVKNNQFAVDLVKQIDKSLLLVGQNQDSFYFQKLEESISDKIEINTGISNAQSVLHHANFGLHTSISETGPLVLIEYIAHGLPFLAYDTGEVARVLKRYFPNFFIDNFDVLKWAERINIINKEKIDSNKLEEVFEKEFGKENYYQKMIKFYTCINTVN